MHALVIVICFSFWEIVVIVSTSIYCYTDPAIYTKKEFTWSITSRLSGSCYITLKKWKCLLSKLKFFKQKLHPISKQNWSLGYAGQLSWKSVQYCLRYPGDERPGDRQTNRQTEQQTEKQETNTGKKHNLLEEVIR